MGKDKGLLSGIYKEDNREEKRNREGITGEYKGNIERIYRRKGGSTHGICMDGV